MPVETSYDALVQIIKDSTSSVEQLKPLLINDINKLALSEQLTEEQRNSLYYLLVKKNPVLIVNIPEPFITHDMCLLSVTALPSLLNYLPDSAI